MGTCLDRCLLLSIFYFLETVLGSQILVFGFAKVNQQVKIGITEPIIIMSKQFCDLRI